MQVTMTINGNEVSEEIEPRLLLVHFPHRAFSTTQVDFPVRRRP